MLMDNIRRLREAAHMSQSELAKMVGVAPSYISGLERGEKKNPSARVIESIADALNVKQEVLFGQSIYSKLEARAEELKLSLIDVIKAEKLTKKYVEEIDTRAPMPWDYDALRALAKALRMDATPLLGALAENEPPTYEGDSTPAAIAFADTMVEEAAQAVVNELGRNYAAHGVQAIISMFEKMNDQQRSDWIKYGRFLLKE